MAAFSLQPATAEDIPRLMQIQFSAFLDPFQYEPYHEVLYPGGNTVAAVAAASDRVLADFHEEPGAHFFKLVHRETGEIIGGCKWLDVPDNTGAPKGVVADWFEESDDRRGHAEHVLDGLYAIRKKYTSEEGYLVLEMLYIEKGWQGKGAGRCAMNWGVARAEEKGWQMVLESTRWARPLYEKYGFVAREHVYLEVPEKWLFRTPVQYFIMHRPAGEKLAKV